MAPPLNPNTPDLHGDVHPSQLWPDQQWRAIPGFPNYMASNGGIIWSVNAQVASHLYTDKRGGHMVKLAGAYRPAWIMVPKLIALCFVPNDDVRNTHVVHKNEQRTDNRASNLRWAHRSELTRELLATTARLEKEPRTHSPSHLSDEDAWAILDASAAGVSAHVLARTFGTSRNSIYGIQRGDTHRHVYDAYHNGNANPQTEA